MVNFEKISFEKDQNRDEATCLSNHILLNVNFRIHWNRWIIFLDSIEPVESRKRNAVVDTLFYMKKYIQNRK